MSNRQTSHRVLVTGGAGFIGSHLCERLLAEGHEVICVDNFSTGRRSNLAAILEHERFEVIRHDVVEPILLEVDWIFNLACPASPVHYQTDPVKTVKTSVLGAVNLLDLADRVRGRILQASTSEVYGDPKVHPQPESYWGNVNPTGPRACYDEGKRVAETLFFDFRRQRSLDARVVRIFNTYGPRMRTDDGRVVSNFIVQALRGEDLTIYGDGSQTRSFCFVDDLVDGLIRTMQHDEVAGPVNLGNPHEITVRELASRVIAMTGSRSLLIERELPTDDPCRRRPDITVAKERLAWEPKVALEAGLASTIAYFEAALLSESR